MIHLIFLEIFKLRKPVLLAAGLILLLLLSALFFKQFDDPPGLVYLMLTGILMLYAVYVGWKQFLPSRFPILGDDALSALHPMVSVVVRWSAYALTMGVLLTLTIALLWWCLATPGHTSRPFDSEELLILLQYWLLPVLLLYGFSALIAQKRGGSRALWVLVALVVVFRLQFGFLVRFSISSAEANPLSASGVVITAIACIALFSSVALASAQRSRLSLNRVSSVLLSCLILFPPMFAVGGWVAWAAVSAFTPKGAEQWLPAVSSGLSKDEVAFYFVSGNLDVIKAIRGRWKEGDSWQTSDVVVEAGNRENRKYPSGWIVDEVTGERSLTFNPVPELLPGDKILKKPASVWRDGVQLQLSEAEQSGLSQNYSAAQPLVDLSRGNLRLSKDPNSTQELQWAVQDARSGIDRLFWNRQKQRFELYDIHQRKLLTHVSAGQAGKLLGYKAIHSPQKRIIVSFERGVWSLSQHGRQLSLTQLYAIPPSQRLLNVVKPHSQYGGKGSVWPVLTNQTFSVYRSEFKEKDRMLHLTELPGLQTSEKVRVYTSQWQSGAVVIMQEQTPGLEQVEILRYDAAGALTSRFLTGETPMGGAVSYGVLVSPIVYSLAPIRSFGVFSVAGYERPPLKTSAWLWAITINVVTILLVLALVKRLNPGRSVAKTWLACAVFFSVPALFMFLIWMPWKESVEQKRVNQA